MDSSYFHSSYYLPHVITNMSTFQIHFMFAPHACGLLGVFNVLYSQCCGMVVWRLNCLYKNKLNGALHCRHLLLAAIKVIRDYKWYMCWQVLKNIVPSGPNGEQQKKHSSPFCVKAWDVGHENSPSFSNTTMAFFNQIHMCRPIYVSNFLHLQ